MESLEHITAEWARKTANTQLGAVAKKQVESVLTRVAEEVKKNQMYANCFFSIDDIAKKEIEKRGFNVERVDGDFRDPREVGYYKVSW